MTKVLPLLLFLLLLLLRLCLLPLSKFPSLAPGPPVRPSPAPPSSAHVLADLDLPNPVLGIIRGSSERGKSEPIAHALAKTLTRYPSLSMYKLSSTRVPSLNQALWLSGLYVRGLSGQRCAEDRHHRLDHLRILSSDFHVDCHYYDRRIFPRCNGAAHSCIRETHFT